MCNLNSKYKINSFRIKNDEDHIVYICVVDGGKKSEELIKNKIFSQLKYQNHKYL